MYVDVCSPLSTSNLSHCNFITSFFSSLGILLEELCCLGLAASVQIDSRHVFVDACASSSQVNKFHWAKTGFLSLSRRKYGCSKLSFPYKCQGFPPWPGGNFSWTPKSHMSASLVRGASERTLYKVSWTEKSDRIGSNTCLGEVFQQIASCKEFDRRQAARAEYTGNHITSKQNKRNLTNLTN